QRSYDIPLSQITVLVTFNFGVQLLIDLLSAGFVDKIGYRAAMVAAHILSAAGLLLLTVLPEILPSPFVGILIAVMLYAMGGGLLEVLVSPVVEACPSDNKEKSMSLLHSFYCWGHVGVVLFSTLFFRFFGVDNWRIMAALWAAVPLCNALVFLRVPFAPLLEDGEKGLSLKELFGMKIFWVLLIMMICAGASESSVSQWASVFAERGLGISKTAGDFAGPMAFAVLMGLGRTFYGKYGEHIKLDRFMIYSSILCIASYLGISLLPIPWLSLAACALCGLSVGIMWPGTFSKAAKALPGGGTAMFALLALGGDVGCSGGPTLVGFISGRFGGNLKTGLLAGSVFPILLLLGILLCKKQNANIRLK
ncbi:MAG: MFS transporter, partial [Butyrivibrio sp.]|nr:MFS transporter [Butyrivibrio sp.]